MNTQILLAKASAGFATLAVDNRYAEAALKFLADWLSKAEFKSYVPQIEHLIAMEDWDYLLDSFYQVIPFGTGGRRGEVGIGPNRINPWTIRISAQGHSQYLLEKHGESAKTRGVVFAYDVREFFGNQYFSDKLSNPLTNLTSKDLAIAASEVYAANGILVYMFAGIRTTPELSFAIRHLHAIAGDMFSASHNPPHHNGKKVYDEYGGQLIPPADEALVNEVTERVTVIGEMPYDEALKLGLIKIIGAEIDAAYISAASKVSLSEFRDISIVYTPLHGCGMTSVYPVLLNLGFKVLVDPKTSNPSGKFENVTFNIPNPEVVQSFDSARIFADENNAEIILSSDPDADRIGIMVKHGGEWVFLNGNEIAVVLANYVIEKRRDNFTGNETMIKTTVTSSLLEKICEQNQVKMIGELLIGFKYVADVMNHLPDINSFLFGCEESHGYLSGDYSRDKDATVPAIWFAELAAELKTKGQTIIDYLHQIYSTYGYYQNYLTEIRLLGAIGKEKIERMQLALRTNPPQLFGKYEVISFEDCQKRLPLVSMTDKVAKDVLIFKLKADDEIKIVIRPSGTEPKIKMYFEIGSKAQISSDLMPDLERAVMRTCYQTIGVDFPERGFLLFWQLPLDDKLKYFEIEPRIEKVKSIEELWQLLAFLGSNPIAKIDLAFKAKYGASVLDYLHLTANAK